MKPPFFLKRGAAARTGSILIYVLWLSALLGLFTLSIGYTVRQKLKMIERVDSRRSLRLAAESGVQRGLWAIHRPAALKNNADTLSSAWSHDDKIFKDILFEQTLMSVVKNSASKRIKEDDYGLIDEESKINVNLLKSSEILKRLLLDIASVSEEDAGVISDSILDWIDADDHLNASGAETQYYQSLKRPLVPKNAPLDSLEELLYVRGVTTDIYKTLSDYLTLFGDGRVNLNTASKSVLLALGLEQAAVDFILSYRAGADGKLSTRDDGVFYNTGDLITAAESSGILSKESISELEKMITLGTFKVTSDYYAVQSKALRKTGGEQLTVKAVISRENGIQSWNETLTHH